jgi:hypothetical protein
MKKISVPDGHFNFRSMAVLVILVIAFSVILSRPAASASQLGDPPAESTSRAALTGAVNETIETALSPLLVTFLKLAASQVAPGTGQAEEGLLSPALLHNGPLLMVVGLGLLLTLFKDVLPVSLVKKPGDATEVATSPVPALMGLALILPGLIEHLTPPAAEAFQAMLNSIGPSQAYAAADPNLAFPGVSALAEWLGAVLAAVAGAIVYAAVWLLSNTLTILCLVVPAPLGPVVKSGRLSLLAMLHTLNLYHPGLALLLSALIILIAFLISRWAFKLTVWGMLYSFDLLTRAWRKREPGPEPTAFITGEGRKVLKIAKRTLGHLTVENGRLLFRYRYFLLFPRQKELPPSERLALGRRLTTPVILLRAEDRLVPLLAFRLSSRTHEELLARRFGGLEVVEVGLSKWLKGACSWMDRGVSRLRTAKATAEV